MSSPLQLAQGLEINPAELLAACGGKGLHGPAISELPALEHLLGHIVEGRHQPRLGYSLTLKEDVKAR